MMKQFVLLATIMSLVAFCSFQTFAEETDAQSATEVVLISEVNWEQLNPARGDASPKAGTLWGDRKGEVPTGFLVKFEDGFSSPPHIHNVTYRGVIISGLIHNDDPQAGKMWMPQGSFWTQPKGEVHITAAQGSDNVAFIEIDSGPYLVFHEEDAFDSGERPFNIVDSILVWVDHSEMDSPNGIKVAYLWGVQKQGQFNGTLVKFPKDYQGKIKSSGSVFRAVVIEGQLNYQLSNGTETKVLKQGSYFGSKQNTIHRISSDVDTTLLYIRTNGKIDFM